MEPTPVLDPRFSQPEAEPLSWEDVSHLLDATSLYFVSTVRVDGRPHVTPLMGIWRDDSMYFCTGADEQKGRNLASNSSCVIAAGTATLAEGVDVVVEGSAARVTDPTRLTALAHAWETKYGPDWQYEVRGGAFHHHGGEAQVFEVRPTKVLAFRNGERGGQTRFRFTASAAV